jgi:hypothetical protein
MARDAIRGRSCELAVQVTLRTGDIHMSTSESKARGGVIELGTRPLDRRVTGLAGIWESSRDVVGIRGLLEISQMARDALLRSASEFVVHVALRAGDADVCAGEREACAGVIELRSRPLHRSVTGLASGGKSGCGVVRIGGFRKVGLMTTNTRSRSSGVLTANVTLCALNVSMGSGQREGRVVVIESRGYPAGSGVANLAFGRQACCLVVWTSRVVVGREMARNASCRRSGELVVRVTRRAGRRCM